MTLFCPLWFLRRLAVVLLLLAGVWALAAQAQPAPRDTSFTVASALRKARKTHPTITLARPAIPAIIQARSNLTYCTVGGWELQLDIFYPKAKRPAGYPAVVLIHGGGWSSGDRSHHVPMAQQLAARGYLTVTADYRLSPEARYPAAVTDLKAAVRWLRAQAGTYPIDTTQIAVWGFSAGGQLAALLGTTNGDPQLEGKACHASRSSSVQAIIDVDGTLAFIHPESGEGDDSKGLSAATRWFGASKTENPALWHQAGALNHVSAQTPPILFLNSAVDRMHTGRDEMTKKLDTFGIYHETHTFAGAPHTFPLFHPWFEPTLAYTAAFLAKVFPPRR